MPDPLYCPFNADTNWAMHCDHEKCALWVISALNGAGCAIAFLGWAAALQIDDMSRLFGIPEPMEPKS
jgi:hypothetical protein